MLDDDEEDYYEDESKEVEVDYDYIGGYCKEDESEKANINSFDEIISNSISFGGDFLSLSGLGLKEIPEEILKFKNLSWLDLSFNNITSIPDWFYDLENIIFLDLSDNLFEELPIRLFIKKNLLRLDLSLNRLSTIPYWIIENDSLKVLDLSNNKLNEFPENLRSFTRLSRLNLQGNSLSSVPIWINELSSLAAINLSNNKIEKFPQIESLINLEGLDLSGNNLTEIPHWIRNFNKLRKLGLNRNKIEELPDEIVELNNLIKIGLGSNLFSQIPNQIQHLRTETLDLSNNKIEIIPSWFESLIQLKYLDLKNTAISDLNPLKDLKLKHLDISNTKVNDLILLRNIIGTGLPVKFENVDSFQFGIYVQGCSLHNPPKGIAEQGNKEILSYWKSKDEALELRSFNEVKIILVGKGNSGKTSLLKKMKGEPFDKGESQTHGVIIDNLSFEELELFKNYEQLKGIKGRFWDFGGQEIMYALHQFFLSEKSIYILLLDSRSNDKPEEWLKQIQKFGGNSHAIIAMNKIERNPNFELERKSLNSKFNFIGNRFHRISCENGEGIESFVKELANLIPKTDIFRETFSPNWIAVKEDLEREMLINKHINQLEYVKICTRNEVFDETAQTTLLKYLNSLGIALHFDDINLNNFYVLDPHWLTIGVYKIINSKVIKNGRFKVNQLSYILNEEKIKKDEYNPAKDKEVEYNTDEQRYLVKIMQQFELLYEYQKGEYLIPSQLGMEPPKDFSFDEKESKNIHFIMKYDFFPQSIISRFIIRMKNDLCVSENIWRTGVELHHKEMDVKAIIRVDNQERLDICVFGETKNKYDYFNMIYRNIEEINSNLKLFNIKKYMPVPDSPEVEIEYEELLGLEAMGETEIVIGKLKKTFSISERFLDKIKNKKERQMEDNKNPTNYIFNDKVESFIVTQNNSSPVQEPLKTEPAITDTQDKPLYEYHWIQSFAKAALITIPIATLTKRVKFEFVWETTLSIFCLTSLFFISNSHKYKYYRASMGCLAGAAVINFLPLINGYFDFSKNLDKGKLNVLVHLAIQDNSVIGLALIAASIIFALISRDKEKNG